jgi:hypothetical protein
VSAMASDAPARRTIVANPLAQRVLIPASFPLPVIRMRVTEIGFPPKPMPYKSLQQTATE